MLDSAASNSNEALVVLAGAWKKDANGKWKTTNFNEGDNFGISGDRVRVVAAAFLFKRNPLITIIASGGKGQLKNVKSAPTGSAVLKKELIELGVPKKIIIEEKKSGNTYEQLLAVKSIIKEKRFKKVSFISNKWHLPRIKKMLEVFPECAEIFNLTEIKLIGAEKVVMANDRKKWQKILKSAYCSEGMKRRIAMERKGIRGISEGKYLR